MSLRSFIGLCEHRWQDIGEIEKKAGPDFGRVIEIRLVQRCTICGKVRSISL